MSLSILIPSSLSRRLLCCRRQNSFRENQIIKAISDAEPDSSYMDLFFNAKSVALVGASPEAGKIGNSVLQSLQHDYKGKVFPVNAKGYQEIMGIKAFKSLDEIDEPVDVVVVTVDLKFVPDLLRAMARKISTIWLFLVGAKSWGDPQQSRTK